MEHYRSERHISYMDIKATRDTGANLYELIDRQEKREVLEQLVDALEYGKTYCVLLERSTTNNGFSETVSFDLRFEKMEG